MKKTPYVLYYEICEKSLKIRLDSIEKFVMLNGFTTTEENFSIKNEERYWEFHAMRYFILRKNRVPGRYVTVYKAKWIVVLFKCLCSLGTLKRKTARAYREQRY